MKTITAYCFHSGHIQFCQVGKMPHGAIAIVTGPQKDVRQAISATARESYPSRPGAKDTVPLVPGIPEAATEAARFDALQNYSGQVYLRLALVPGWIKEQSPYLKLATVKAAYLRLHEQAFQMNPDATANFLRTVSAIIDEREPAKRPAASKPDRSPARKQKSRLA